MQFDRERGKCSSEHLYNPRKGSPWRFLWQRVFRFLGGIHTHRMIVKGNELGIANIGLWNPRVINLVNTEGPVLVAKIGNIKFGDPRSSACSFRVTITRFCCYLSDLFFHIGRRVQFLAGMGDGTSAEALFERPTRSTQ